jgi:Ca2+/Na+ antiporter
MSFLNNPSLLSFTILLVVLGIFFIVVAYLIYKLYKKDQNRVTPIEQTAEYKKADASITTGILELNTATTHQELRMSLRSVEDGLRFFKMYNLKFSDKTPDEIIELLQKHSQSKLLEMYEDLEKDIENLSSEDREKLMEFQKDNMDEYKAFKKTREEERKELRERIIVENERDKVLNELLKRDEEYFEQKRLEKLREELMAGVGSEK